MTARKKVYIACPTRDAMCTGAARDSIQQLALDATRDFDVMHDVAQSDEDLVRTRSRMIRQFLESDATDLLFADADVAWSPALIRGMVATGLPIVMAPYPKHRIDWGRVEEYVKNQIAQALAIGCASGEKREDVETRAPKWRAFIESLRDLEAMSQHYPIHFLDRVTINPANHSLPIAGAGLGCSLWSRTVLQQLTNAHEDALSFDDGPDLDRATVALTMPILDRDGNLLGEDLSLCRRAAAAGWAVNMYLGPGSPASHVGSYFYPGKLEAFGTVRKL